MFKELKAKSIKKTLVPAILLIIIGLIVACMQLSNVLAILKGHTQFESLKPDEIKANMIVDVDLSVNLGAFLEEYEENTKTHVTRTTDMYYVIWTGDENEMDYRFMGIKVDADDITKMDEMSQAYFNGESYDTIRYSGNIQKMTGEELEYFEEYFLEVGFEEDVLDDMLLPYYINAGALTGGSAATTWVLFIIGLLLCAGGVLLIVLAASGSRLKAIRKELEEAGIGENDAEYEYENAKDFHVSANIRIGRRMIFYMNGSKPHIILKDKLIWAYQNTTTHRTNGIKTGTTYAVIFGTMDKKRVTISVSKEAQALEILQYIGQTMPWTVVGYSDELMGTFYNNFQEFLQIAYNPAVSNGQMQA